MSPREAQALMEQEGWFYVDVRSVPEFERGHPAGAWNVPLLDFQPALGGMVPNPEFVPAMERHFRKDQPLIVGCQMGGRSTRAADLLERAGYVELAEMAAGFDGRKDVFGRLLEPGWGRAGLPVAIDAPPERRWSAMRRPRG